MKHSHDAQIDVKLDIPTQDLEDLIDKATNAALTIIAAATVAHIFKKFFETPR